MFDLGPRNGAGTRLPPNTRGSGFTFRACIAACAILPLPSSSARAANQTLELSPIVIGAPRPFATQIGAPLGFAGNDVTPSLQSFVRASHFDAALGHSQWLVLGGMTNGMHDITGSTGFDPASHNQDVFVIDPVTKQVWSRSLNDASSGLTAAQVGSLATTNAQYSQKGSRLYVAGGYGPITLPNGDLEYQTFDQLHAIDVPGLVDWVKGGAGSAASRFRQISDPTFRVTGGEMATTANGRTHLVFGQDYPSAYEPRQNGIYTKQVRTFTIIDDGTVGGLSVADVVAGPVVEDYRRRDLNVVPILRRENGQLVDKLQALSGVFTTSFGAWTVPVTIDDDGTATQPDPAAPGTFKQGMNAYRSATIGLYSASRDEMHTLLLGGISYQTYNPATGTIVEDVNLPFTSDATDLVTDAAGNMTQHLLPSTYPDVISTNTGSPLLLGAETEFFLRDGVPTLATGVIDLDALTGPTLVGWLYGGIAAEQPNFGQTHASNAIFPVVITPAAVPEPAIALFAPALAGLLLLNRRHPVRGVPSASAGRRLLQRQTSKPSPRLI